MIAKARLNSRAPDYAGFLHLLRLAILSIPIKKVRDSARAHLQQAHEAAADSLAAWNVYDFDSTVFGSSRKEGVWEGETLLRIAAHVATCTMRDKVRGDEDFISLVDAARKVSMVPISGGRHGLEDAGKQALSYQRSELYLPAEIVRFHHLPLSAGDIFKYLNVQIRKSITFYWRKRVILQYG